MVLARALRGFADGFVSVLLADHLLGLGFSPLRVGVIVTGTLIGSALLTLVVVPGTMNPSAGDVSVFLPTEQAFLAQHATGHERTRLYALYSVAGNLAGALGALLTTVFAGRAGFVVYDVLLLVTFRDVEIDTA